MPPQTPEALTLKLPPFSYLSHSFQGWLEKKRLIIVHLAALGILYGALTATAAIEGTIFIRNGIGILQNPPFFVHLLCCSLSIPLVLLISKRIINLSDTDEGRRITEGIIQLIQKDKKKDALFSVAFLFGLFALAYTVAMSASYKVNIYDSISHPATFIVYFILRAYTYLFCYPLVFAMAPTITYYLFRELGQSKIPYRPFHFDEAGGLRKYFTAVDRPVYAVQSFAVLIALMNYFGWGGMAPVPMALAIAAPIVVTLLAIFLFVHFRRVLTSKIREEVQSIRLQQMEIYLAARGLASSNSKECLELLERIEATERLIESVKRGSRNGLKKYFVNIGLLLLSQAAKPVGELLAHKLFSIAP